MLKLKKHEPFGVYFLVAPCPNGGFLLAPPFQIELQGVGRRRTAFEAWTFVTWAVLEGWSPPNLRVVDSDGWICCENVWKAEKWKVLLRWSIWLVGFQLDYVFHESIGWWSDDRDSVGLVFHESFLITRDFSEIDFETVLSWTSFPPAHAASNVLSQMSRIPLHWPKMFQKKRQKLCTSLKKKSSKNQFYYALTWKIAEMTQHGSASWLTFVLNVSDSSDHQVGRRKSDPSDAAAAGLAAALCVQSQRWPSAAWDAGDRTDPAQCGGAARGGETT